MRFRRARALGSRPSVSVVIPCTTTAGTSLRQCHPSCSRGVQVDILIVDDASTDGSAQIAHSLATMYPEVDVLVHEENRGHTRPTTMGWRERVGRTSSCCLRTTS